jgi:uncharacterized repeat protein (TIGR02543 family)
MGIDHYTISGTGPRSEDHFIEEEFQEEVFSRDALTVGNWEIVVDAYNSDATKILTTTINVMVRKSQTVQAEATLSPIIGVGSLGVSVSWTDSQNKLADPQVYMFIRDEKGNEIPAYQNAIQLILDDGGRSAAGVVNEIPTGWYEVSVGLYEGIPDGNPEVVWQDIYTLRIVNDATTEGVVLIPKEEIRYGEGSISLVVEEELENPFGVSFTGLPESVKEEEEVTIAATGTYGDDATYRWYVNGIRQEESSSELAFRSNSAGSFYISLLVTSDGIVSGHRQSIEILKASEEVAADISTLAIGYSTGESASSVSSDIILPSSGTHGTRITWESSNTNYISTSGTVVRPSYVIGDTEVQLTATVERGTAQEIKTFNLTVIRQPITDAEAVALDKDSLEVGFSGLDNAEAVTQDLLLTSSGVNGTSITWESSIPETISTTGGVARPDYTEDSDIQVTLTATINKGSVSDTKTFILTVKIQLQEQTVTFVSNDGSGVTSQIVYWGQLVEEPDPPVKDGYIFDGWYSDSALTSPWNFESDYIDGDTSLYARWSKEVTINFDPQGGVSLNPQNKIVMTNNPYGELATTIKAGYTFTGWSTEPDGAGNLINSSTIVTNDTEHTLYAVWQANTQIITFDLQSGPDVSHLTKEVTYSQPYGTLPIPTRDNHTFDGWWTGIDGEGSVVTAETTFTELIDCTIYAKWLFNVYTGPAGGLVFYENPDWENDNWRYLEIAPEGWYTGEIDSNGTYNGEDDPEFQWGSYMYEVIPSAKSIEIGSGVVNTAAIETFHDSLWTQFPDKGDYYVNPTKYYYNSDGTVAAKICAEHSTIVDGVIYDDWFLPSYNELKRINTNLFSRNLGGLADVGYYWSSSEINSEIAYGGIHRELGLGLVRNYRSARGMVRPVRAF